MKKIATYQDGAIIRNKEIEKAKLSIAKEEEELSKLKNEEKSLKELVAKLKGTIFFSPQLSFQNYSVILLKFFVILNWFN
jgi:cell division protein FtsB